MVVIIMKIFLKFLPTLMVILSFQIKTYVLGEENIKNYDDDVTTDPAEEEWHMDFMPTGYLPDSVYRELAWYGILQIQPLHHSAKYKVAAQLIWEHTLGRPHVIMENPPQSLQSPGKISRQILAEEAAKWSREQRSAQETLMETIRTGGNGLTVRTVHGPRETTSYIIQNGLYYVCPPGSEPDIEEYRLPNLHNRGCTFGQKSQPVPLDPCVEAETAQLEYSFHEGWMFCLGTGDRENNYFPNGTLDCGERVKVTVDDFLNMCAIDNNIIISYDYFGDEPRKDTMHNATICTAWDPCHLSYLYRFEPSQIGPMPVFPSPKEPDSICDTTVCPDCIDHKNGSKREEDIGVPVDIDSESDIENGPVPPSGDEGSATPTTNGEKKSDTKAQSADVEFTAGSDKDPKSGSESEGESADAARRRLPGERYSRRNFNSKLRI